MTTPKQNVDLVLSSNFAYGSKRMLRFLTGTRVDVTESDDMRTWKASIGLEGNRWSLELYGDNLSNDDGSVTSPSAGVAFTSVRQRPRTIGLQAAFSY